MAHVCFLIHSCRTGYPRRVTLYCCAAATCISVCYFECEGDNTGMGLNQLGTRTMSGTKSIA